MSTTSSRRIVTPSTRFAPISARLEAPLQRVLHAKEVPKLSKEELAKHRNEVKKYYSELSRKKQTTSSTPAPRPRVAPPPPPPEDRTRFVTQRKPVSNKPPPNPRRSTLAKIEEHPAEVVWEEMMRLTEKLSEMQPIAGVAKEDVEKHVDRVRRLVFSES